MFFYVLFDIGPNYGVNGKILLCEEMSGVTSCISRILLLLYIFGFKCAELSIGGFTSSRGNSGGPRTSDVCTPDMKVRTLLLVAMY